MKQGSKGGPYMSGEVMSLADAAGELGIEAIRPRGNKVDFYKQLGDAKNIYSMQNLKYQLIDVVLPYDLTHNVNSHDYLGNGMSVQDGSSRREIPGNTVMPDDLKVIAAEHVRPAKDSYDQLEKLRLDVLAGSLGTSEEQRKSTVRNRGPGTVIDKNRLRVVSCVYDGDHQYHTIPDLILGGNCYGHHPVNAGEGSTLTKQETSQCVV